MIIARLSFLYLIVLFVFLSCTANQEQKTKPNIILIMSDDMGYSDIGCYGGVINTPHLDELAANGLRYTNFYNTSRCCPTRASLLTGLYQHQAGIGHMMDDKGHDAYRGDLSDKAVTIAEVLKESGYSTYMSGKWHVTPYLPNDENPPKHNWPKQRGFDKFFGTILGAGSFYDPASLTRENDYIVPSEGFYYTDAISKNAIDFVNSHSGENPFFMYVSHTAAHWPMHAKPEDIAKYEGKFDDGWDALREKKFEKMSAIGLANSDWKLSEKDDIENWEDAENKEWQSSLMEVYAAMVDCMDQGIGNLMKSLEDKGIKDNTLVFFLQDNGGCAEGRGLHPNMGPHHKGVNADDMKPMGEDERQKGMVPRFARDGRPVISGVGVEPGGADTYVAYGKAWANASNTPFRMYKHWVHEGGIASPLIVHWPEGLKAKNEFRDQPSHLIDIMATCVDVAGAKYPETFNGNPITPLEGLSLAPSFTDESLGDRAIYWEHEGNKAVRLGKYKLVSRWKKEAEYDWELYDLEADRSETNNLVEQMPDKVRELEDLWMLWARKVGAIRWDDKELI